VLVCVLAGALGAVAALRSDQPEPEKLPA